MKLNHLPTSSRRVAARGLISILTLVAAVRLASAGQAELAAAIGETRAEVVATRDQLQNTVTSLDALVKQKEGDLKPAYDAFVTQVAKTQADAAVTKARALKMQKEAQTHFDGWQKEIDSINNAKLKKQAQKRMDKVQRSYEKLTVELTSAGTSFAPYLSDLSDITKMLANDLTPGGIKAIRGTVGQAKFDLQSVRSHVSDAIKTLDGMQKSLSSSAAK